MTETERFICSTEDGTKYEVIVYQATIHVPLLDGPEGIPGIRNLMLSIGGGVNETDDPDVFTLPDGQVLRRVRP